MTLYPVCNKRFDDFIYWIAQNTLQMLSLTLLSSRYFITFYLCFTLLVKKKHLDVKSSLDVQMNVAYQFLLYSHCISLNCERALSNSSC